MVQDGLVPRPTSTEQGPGEGLLRRAATAIVASDVQDADGHAVPELFLAKTTPCPAAAT